MTDGDERDYRRGIGALASAGLGDGWIDMRWDWRSATGMYGEPSVAVLLTEWTNDAAPSAASGVWVHMGAQGNPVGVRIAGPGPVEEPTVMASSLRRRVGARLRSVRRRDGWTYRGFGGRYEPARGTLILDCGWGDGGERAAAFRLGRGPLAGTEWSVALDANGTVKRVTIASIADHLTPAQIELLQPGFPEYPLELFDAPALRREFAAYFECMGMATPEWVLDPRLRNTDAIGRTMTEIGEHEDERLAMHYDEHLPADFGELLTDAWLELIYSESG